MKIATLGDLGIRETPKSPDNDLSESAKNGLKFLFFEMLGNIRESYKLYISSSIGH